METTNAIVQQHWFDMPEVRRIDDAEGNPWWVAKDVCEYFGDTHYRRSMSRLRDKNKGVTLVPTAGGPQRMTIINEPGLYRLMFAMQPSKSRIQDERTAKRVEQLERFRDWVFEEVLPSIHKNGGYFTPKKLDEFMEDPVAFAEYVRKAAEIIIAKKDKRCETPEAVSPFAMFNFMPISCERPQLAASEMVIDV